MTCLERYLKEHPDANPDDVVNFRCPHRAGYVSTEKARSFCINDPDIRDDCERCWNQEVDEPYNVVEELEPLPGNPDCAVPAVDVKDYPGYLDRPKKILDEAFCAAGKAAEHAGKVLKETFTLNLPSEAPETPVIKDSGDRTEFATGAVRDMREGKGRCDLMPLDVCSDFLHHLCDGNPKTARYKQSAVLGYIFSFTLNGDKRNLYQALIAAEPFVNPETMFLEVAKHFEDGAKKYGENNWQKGIPVKCYIDSAVRHYLKYLRGDKDEPHDRAFVWNILCCIWTCKHHPELNEYARKEENNGEN